MAFFEMLVGFIGMFIIFLIVLLILKLATSIYEDIRPHKQEEQTHKNNLRSINGGD